MKALDYVKVIAVTFAVFFLGVLLNLPQGIVVFSSIAALFVAVSLHTFHEDQKKQKEAAKQAEKQFYEECRSYQITSLADLTSPEKQQRFDRIASKYHFSKASKEDLQKLFDTYNALQAQKDQQELDQQRQSEIATFQQLTFYANLHGMDKPVAILSDLQKQSEAAANGTKYIPTRKESDGAVMAGIASGIGGTIPALMSLSNTAQHNANIRQYNAMVNTANQIMAQGALAAQSRALKYKETLDNISIKLVADLPPDQLFQKLTFTAPSIQVSKFGSVTISTKVTADTKLEIFNHLPAFIDGSVIGEIYDGAQKIGEAVMVFPILGSLFAQMDSDQYGFCRLKTDLNKPVQLEGMCLFCGQPGKKYTVKFVPGDLWAMER